MAKSKALTTTTANSLAQYSERAQAYARKAHKANTMRAYRSAVIGSARGDARRSFPAFESFAQARGETMLTADAKTVIDYLVALADAGASLATIEQRRAAIIAARTLAGLPDPFDAPDVRRVLKGIRNEVGKPARKKQAVMVEDLQAMVDTFDGSTLQGKRNRALLLLGFAGAFRRSELVALDVADLKRTRSELRVMVAHSKTDQDGEGITKHIPLDDALGVVESLRDWLDAARIKSGPVFRRVDRWGKVHSRLTDQMVARIVKRAALAAGLDARQFAGHSLRAGFATAAILAGLPERDVMQQTGHKSERVFRGYVRDAGAGALKAARAVLGASEG